MCVCVFADKLIKHSDRINSALTFFIEEKLVEAQATGLLPNETVHILCAVVMDSDGIFQGLDT